MKKHLYIKSLTTLLNKPISNNLLITLTALYITILFNRHIFGILTDVTPPQNITDYLFILSVYFTIFSLIFLCCSLFAFGKSTKWWLGFLLIASSATSYMRSKYNVVFDDNMIRNIVETDYHEASELLSLSWAFYILLLGILPIFVIKKLRVKKHSIGRSAFHHASYIIGIIIAMLVSIAPFYSSYASMLRSHRSMKEYIIPTGFLYSSYKYVKNSVPTYQHSLVSIGADAKRASPNTQNKKMVFVIVVGETARAANFSLAGYARQTNTLLEARLKHDTNTVFYSQFFSCGTSTAISVPCMFSSKGRETFDVDEAKYTENLLDIFNRTGLDVLWIDNNSGCKGVCDRITYTELRNRTDDPSCDIYGCNDSVLVSDLEQKLQSIEKDTVIVLHQKGSHGPAYFERVPKDKQVFQPICHSNQLQECTESEIINSYDNTIVYTDFILEQIIKTLEKHSDSIDTGMFYASDHGESLGERNLYLHGMPYSIAPDEQIHIPALLWLSQGFTKHYSVNTQCLRNNSNNNYSHDNIFYSLLGLLDIQTTLYTSNEDMIKPCKQPS
jgi:lipid A ethanolaminephosphotransferase